MSEPSPPLLRAAPPSTSVELTRWALDYYGVAFTPRFMAPVFHVAYQWRHRAPDQPILVDGPLVMAIERQIIDFFETRAPLANKLYPQSKSQMLQFEDYWDVFLGRMAYATRAWAYYHLLPEKALSYPCLTFQTPRIQRVLVSLTYPIFWRLMWFGLKSDQRDAFDRLGDDEFMADAMANIEAAFDKAEHHLRLSPGRKFILGGRFSLADMLFCTFAAPMVLPDEYGGGLPLLPRYDDLSPDLRKAMRIDEFRKRDAGDYVLRIYKEYRNSPRGAPSVAV